MGYHNILVCRFEIAMVLKPYIHFHFQDLKMSENPA